MKILFFIPTLGAGGAERALLQLVNNYANQQDELHVRTMFNDGKYIEQLSSRVKYSYVFKKKFRGNIHLLKLFSPRFLFRHMISEKFDIIISYLEGPTTRIVSGCDGESKIINWVHTSPTTEKVLTKSYRSRTEFLKCSQKYDKTIFVAESAQRQFVGLFPELKDIYSQVIYNPINTMEIQNKAKNQPDVIFNPREFNIVSIGRLAPVKGYKRLIEIFILLQKNLNINLHLYIVGDGGDRLMLNQLIIDEKADKYVTLLGYKENPYPYLKQANLYVCSSYREGYNTSVIEALVLGIPVVTTLCSGMEEILGCKSEYGVITPNTDKGLYEKLEILLKDQSLYNYYCKQAATRGEDFCLHESIAEVEKAIKEI